MRVVLTREAGYNERQRDWLTGHAHVDEVPLTTTLPLDQEIVDAQVAALSARHVRYIVVSSARGANCGARAARVLGAPLLSVGASTSAALRERGLEVRAEAASASDLAPFVDEGPVLSLGAAETRPELADALAARGIETLHVACYETRALELTEAQRDLLARGDVVLIGAPSAWALAREHVAASAWVVVPGETTRACVRRDHERVLVGWSSDLATRLASLGPESAQ